MSHQPGSHASHLNAHLAQWNNEMDFLRKHTFQSMENGISRKFPAGEKPLDATLAEKGANETSGGEDRSER